MSDTKLKLAIETLVEAYLDAMDSGSPMTAEDAEFIAATLRDLGRPELADAVDGA